MKLTKTLLIAAVAGTIAFVSGQAMASTGEITVSATVKEQNTNSISKDTQTSKITSASYNNAKIYSLISNAVVNVGTNGTGIAPGSLPANGYIVFDPNGNDGMVSGTFYATNKSGFYYPLSGLDTNGDYYSFIELDTYSADTDDTNNVTGAINFGFSDNFNGVESGTFNAKTGDGSEGITSTALLYVHDNAYSFNDGNNADEFYSNNNALEIRGIAQMNLTFKDGNVTEWSVSLNGTGNAVVNNSQNAVVTSGQMSGSQ